MGRPRLRRSITVNPQATFFKPRGVPLRDLKCVILTMEEIQALRLKDMDNLDQISCAKKMNTSQSTFQRILRSAHRKVSRAVLEGKAIKVRREQ